jgi:hypothetical protein
MTAQTDATPNSRRSPMEHERDLPDAAQTDAPERIWAQDAKPDECNFIGGGWWDDSCGNTQYPHIVGYVRADLHDAAQNRAYWLAIAICGGEDAPGYVDSVPLATLTDMLRKERRWRDDALDAAQAEIAKLRAENDRLRGIGIMPRFHGVWSATGVHIGTWDDGYIAAKILAEYPNGVIRDLIDATVYHEAQKEAQP